VKKGSKNSVITINSYNGDICKVTQNNFSKLSKLKRANNDTLISCIANKDLIIEPVELSASLPPDSIDSVITDKVYDELRLDPAIEYEISPIKTSYISNKIKYQTFIVDKNELKNQLSNISKKVKVIDYVIPSPLLYKSLYQSKILDTNSIDMFIYFGDYDTFITFYKKGEYLYSKSIKFSLENIYDRFIELSQDTTLNQEQFKNMLSSVGLKSENDKHRELLIRIMNECFLTINDVVIYTKRAYDIKDIKKGFIGFSWGYLDGIEAYAKNYLNVDAYSMDTLFSSGVKCNAIDKLMYLTAQELNSSTLELPNFTPYPKPLPIAKRPSGKIISLFIVIVLLFMIPIAYDYFVGLSLKGQNIILEKKEQKLTAIANRYKASIKQKREELKALDKALDKTSKLYDTKKEKLTQVYNKKFNYSLRSEQLALITNILKGYDIKSREIEIDDNRYLIEIESKDDKEITLFIKQIVSKLNKSIKDINIRDIKFDKLEGLYKGKLVIEFKEGV